MIRRPFSARETALQEQPARVTPRLAQGRIVTPVASGAGLVVGQPEAVATAMRPQDPDRLAPAWFESLIPAPKEDVAAQLKPDAYLKGTSTHFRLDSATYQRELAIRLRMKEEGRDDDYTFAPFMTLLDNMRAICAHCLAERQFEDTLAADEHRAFVALLGHIREMRRLGAPYKRTIWLAVLLATVQEVVSGRHVIDGLRQDARALWENERVQEFVFYPDFAPRQYTRRCLTYRQMDLDRVLACRWGGLNPEGVLDQFTEFLDGSLLIHGHLPQWLDTPTLFLCPSFEPLEPADFCRLGHLPICPLGLTTRAAIKADGVMRTPLSFLERTLLHFLRLGHWSPRHDDSEILLASCAGRERFRWLVLDSLPASLRRLERALTLIVFYLLHEVPPGIARELMKYDHCGRLLHSINEVRRVRRWDWPVPYQRISDEEAWLACHWAHGLYSQLAEEPGACRPAADWIAQCLAQTLPQAREQWRFFAGHRDAIGVWLRSREVTEKARDGGLHHAIACRSTWCYRQFHHALVPFWEDHNKRCEGPVDYTDVAYFAVLHHPELREQMMQALPGLQAVPDTCLTGCSLERHSNEHSLTEENLA